LKILILKPSSLGDVVQALPVLRLLKLSLPESQIYWWISSEFVSLLHGDPDLAGIFPFNRRRWTLPVYWAEPVQSLREMRAHRFDWVIDLQSLARSAICAWLANGNFTIGLGDQREGAPAFYDASVPRPSYYTHAVDWYLEVLRFLNIPIHSNFSWLPRRLEAIESIQRKWAPEKSRWIIVNPGARWWNKRWPIEYYQDLVARILDVYPDVNIAIMGAQNDAQLGAALAKPHPERCLDLTGKTSLTEMVEWVRISELMVTNDTGPMHIAAALGKPTVAIFGPTEPRRTGPYHQIQDAVRIQLPCSPCLKPYCRYHEPIACLRNIAPASVFQHVQRRLKGLNNSHAACVS
jgi:lipopolysaccharide heptosyltransferase I